MDFFAEQDRARRNTLLLIVLMTAAVVCLIFMTAVAASLILYFTQQHVDSPRLVQAMNTSWLVHLRQVWQSDFMYYAGTGVLAMVLGGSTYKLVQLGGHGRKVAEALGGRIIPPNTSNPQEKKILNVVEEMAIASGNPVPPVYVLEEPGINAFAAGTDRRNAVVGITRGALELLNREELQGVVAHEFSHIHNGDMRLNLRLVAILHGILIIGLLGALLLRSTNRRGKNQGAQLGLGLAFWILGYCGVFFGSLIKAAVSRQREFLADASAVQFTRNPAGVANALKKIGGHAHQARLDNPKAAEFSHMYFGQGIKTSFNAMFSTHPPLAQRIRKIEPRWDGVMMPQASAAEAPSSETTLMERAPPTAVSTAGVALAAAVAQIGNPGTNNLADAQLFIQQLPAAVYEAAHEPFSCRALIYGLLLDAHDPQCRARQLALLRSGCDPETLRALSRLEPDLARVSRSEYLEIVDLAMPALKTLSTAQYATFKKELTELIRADEKVSLLEWCLYRIVTAGYENKVHRGQLRLQQLAEAAGTVLLMACTSGKTCDLTAAFTAAADHLPGMTLAPPESPRVSMDQFDRAVKQLERLRPLEKPQFLKALGACMQADGKITSEEVELFRALADCLDCPVPLLKIE